MSLTSYSTNQLTWCLKLYVRYYDYDFIFFFIVKYMKKILECNLIYRQDNALIFDALGKDIDKCKDYLEQFRDL